MYIDQFNMAFNNTQRYSYDVWDSTTVDIDRKTGGIVRRYTDAGLVGTLAQKDLAEYVLSKGQYMLANTFPAVPEMQSIRMHRFAETEWSIDVFSWDDGAMPPISATACKGHLTTPISLGFRAYRYGKNGMENYARVIHKGAIAYLRNGLLYYHYISEIPELGPGAGEYGAINYMFPLTPVELHPGWIVGNERIVTCISGTFQRSGISKPSVLVFDLSGRRVRPHITITQEVDYWQIELKLKDWAEIAVIE